MRTRCEGLILECGMLFAVLTDVTVVTATHCHNWGGVAKKFTVAVCESGIDERRK
jgi:hypothetical protein